MSGNLTPLGNGGQATNTGVNLSQISQLLKGHSLSRQNSITVSGHTNLINKDSCSNTAETRDMMGRKQSDDNNNTQKRSLNNTGMHNNFSFNKLLTPNGTPINPQGNTFQQQLNMKL